MRTISRDTYKLVKLLRPRHNVKSIAFLTGASTATVYKVLNTKNYKQYKLIGKPKSKIDKIYDQHMQYEPVGENPKPKVWQSILGRLKNDSR